MATVGAANGDQATLDNGMDLEFGPEGALYGLEYGDGFFSENPTPSWLALTTSGRAAITPRAWGWRRPRPPDWRV